MIRLRRVPQSVILVACLAAVLRMIPWLWAGALTPDGWVFTGNLTNSPDYMQYRVWFRQSQIAGPLVTNVFTTEPNRPHLLVLYPWAIGAVGKWLSLAPEFVYAYAGAALTVAMVLLLWLIVRQFFPDTYQAWWVFLAVLVGGGFGAHLKLLTRFEVMKRNPLIERVLLEPLRSWPVFEDRRGHYLFQTLFDTHFLLFWVLAVLCMATMYAALRRRGWVPLVVLGLLCGLLTLVHLYEGVTLLAVAASVAAVYWIKGVRQREALTVLAVVAPVVGLCLGWQVWLAGRSGIPISDWREQSVLVSLLFLAYPLSWVLLARGLRRFWTEARPEHLFLLAWAFGCTVLALSGPFNPYPQRGTLTMMIPIGLLAGLEYFRERPRVSSKHALLAMLVLAPTPLWFMATTAVNMRFEPTHPETYLDSAHRDVVDALRHSSTSQDVLLARPAANVWLAPDFGGRLYCGHFFLTVDFERKRRETEGFFADTSEGKRNFLLQKGIRFVFAAASEASGLAEVDGLRPVLANTAGALYAFDEVPGHAGR